jgi:hypothetical protein
LKIQGAKIRDCFDFWQFAHCERSPKKQTLLTRRKASIKQRQTYNRSKKSPTEAGLKIFIYGI